MSIRYSMMVRLFAVSLLFCFSNTRISGQARLVVNGATLTIANGGYLVIGNSASNAITRSSGYIVSEGQDNIVKWNIGETTGTYVVPWGDGSSNYIPLSFTKTAGRGTAGSILFSTYHTPWMNSGLLPTGVANFNSGSGADNSAFAIDRFWQVNASGYLNKPSLSNLLFTYLDSEFASPNTSSVESSITAQRWNDVSSTWLDYVSTGTVDAVANTLTLTSVTPANLYKWWTVTYAPDRHWTAAAPSNWNNPLNWSYTAGGTGGVGVPSSLNSVLLDAVRNTDLTLDANATISSLTIDPGYSGTLTQGANTLTINNGASLSGGIFQGGSSDINVSGPFTLSGTSFTSTSASLNLTGDFDFTGGSFIHNNGSVNFSGTTTQSVNGSVAADFNNISVTNTANPGVSIESNQNLIGVLTLAPNAIVDADGSSNSGVLKLISTGDGPTQDAAVAVLPSGAQVTGDVTVQRFMTKEGANNNRIYRYISSPVQNASVADLQNEIPVTGSFTGTSACAGCGAGQTMFSYRESDITDSNGSGVADFNDGYIDFPNAANTETLIPGKGYAMYVRGNILSSTLWDVRGPINRGNVTPVSLPVSYTSSGNILDDGWNLVGNPFPSTIDWNATSGWTKTNLDATTYTTDNGNASLQYATWNGVTGTNGGSRHLATGQAFWVKANGVGTPVLQATENIKAAGTQTTFFRQGSPDNLLRITMVKGITRDEAVIHFRKDATINFDAHADALKLPNGTFNLSSLQPDGKKLAINSITPMDCSAEVKLNIANAAAGSYRLNFAEHDSFIATTSIVLQDNFTSSTFDVRSGGSYDFSVTTSPASYGPDRFKITFALPPLNSDFLLSATNVCEGSEATVQVNNSQSGINYFLSSTENNLAGSVIGTGGTISFSIPGNDLKVGQNNFTVVAMMNGCTAKVEKTISFNQVPKFLIESVTEGKRCGDGAVTLQVVGAPVDGHYNWYESASSVVPIADQHADFFTTPALIKTKTYYAAAVNSVGCEGDRKAVLAKIIVYDNAQITPAGDSLQSNFANGNQWYFNHQPIPQATGQSIWADQTGTYSTTVSIEGCATSANYDFVKTPEVIVTTTEVVTPTPEVIVIPETVVTAIEPSIKDITFFPNPVSTEINVSVPKSLKAIKKIRVLNGIGQFIGLIELQDGSEVRSGRLDMTHYPAGLYILQVVGTQEILEAKIIKQ